MTINDTQNGSRLTLLKGDALAAELDRVEREIKGEIAIIQARMDAAPPIGSLEPVDLDERAAAEHEALSAKRLVWYRRTAIVWIYILGVGVCAATGFRIAEEMTPKVERFFSVTQVGSVENGEG